MPTRKPQPGNGLFGWLGRQVGYVVKAVKEDPAKKLPKPQAAPATLYRNTHVEEVPHPSDPNVKLRRTVIDEAVAEPPAVKPRKPTDAAG